MPTIRTRIYDGYYSLSNQGLEQSDGFKAQFPPNSEALNKFTLYITYGRAYLNL